MKISCNNIRIGNIIKHKNELFTVIKTQHTQPGKKTAQSFLDSKPNKQNIQVNYITLIKLTFLSQVGGIPSVNLNGVPNTNYGTRKPDTAERAGQGEGSGPPGYSHPSGCS